MIHSMELLENCRLEHYIMYESQCNILVYEKNRTGETYKLQERLL